MSWPGAAFRSVTNEAFNGLSQADEAGGRQQGLRRKDIPLRPTWKTHSALSLPQSPLQSVGRYDEQSGWERSFFTLHAACLLHFRQLLFPHQLSLKGHPRLQLLSCLVLRHLLLNHLTRKRRQNKTWTLRRMCASTIWRTSKLLCKNKQRSPWHSSCTN